MSNFKILELKSWNHFFEITQEFETLGGFLPYWSFRGQSDSSWTLNPSLARILKFKIYHPLNASKIEASLTRYFLSNNKHFREFKGLDLNTAGISLIQVWSFMQHYGAPTRLLDWTDSPLIGLYYAVESNFEKDGALYIINNDIITASSTERYGKIDAVKMTTTDFSNSISSVVTIQSTRRSYNQQGLYTISNNPLIDQEEAIESLDLKPNSALKLIIPKSLKVELLRKLRSSNVKADILYPDAYGLGKELNNLAIIRSHEFND